MWREVAPSALGGTAAGNGQGSACLASALSGGGCRGLGAGRLRQGCWGIFISPTTWVLPFPQHARRPLHAVGVAE